MARDEATPAPAQRSQDIRDSQLDVVFVDQSKDAADEARDLADARLDRELHEGGRIKRFLNGVWKGNLAKDFYRQRYVNDALSSMQEAGSVLVSESQERRAQALQATIQRFGSAYSEELIHEEAGERREVRSDDDMLTQGVKQLVREFAQGNLSAESLQEERTRLFNEYRRSHGAESIGDGLMRADNLVAIAQAVAGAVEHGESLDYAVGRLRIITGEARNGARSEARYTAVDRIVDKLAKNRVTSLVTPGTLAVSVAAAASIVRVGSHSVVGALTKTLIPGGAAGMWAGLRENRRVKDERVQHSREMAVGSTFRQGDTRREQMDTTRYETIPATDLAQELERLANAQAFQSGGSDALEAALDALAVIQARTQLSDSRRIDLISYSSKAAVGEERMMLDLARHGAVLAIEQELTTNVRGVLGNDPSAYIREMIRERSAQQVEILAGGEGELSAKDRAFLKLKSKRVASAVAVGVATGVLGGLVVQEGVAAVDPTRFGLIDEWRGATAMPLTRDGAVHQTILEGWLRGDGTTVHTAASPTYDSYVTAQNGTIELSADHTLVTNQDGTINLVDGNGNVSVEGLVVDANGTFDRASLDKLNAAGMMLTDTSFDQTITETTAQTVSVDQFLQNHSAQATHVTRDFWYGNDTPSIYDENELRLYRGGSAAAPGIIDGGYQYTVAGMQPDGSWQGGESVDWSQAAERGNLFVAVSGTYDSQATPFMIPINPDGSINISADSPAGKFFANENGSVGFNGAYMEVVQTAGVDTDGTVHIRPLATLVGERSVTQVVDTTAVETVVHHSDYSITTPGYDTIQTNFTEMAPITPVASRRSLEPLAELARSRHSSGGYGYYNGRESEGYRQQVRTEVSPRLQADPNKVLEPAEELDWFRGKLKSTQGTEYVDDLEKTIEGEPQLSSLHANTGAIVVIPVAAAVEADNIYKTLSLYAQQETDASAPSTILLNVNWLDTSMADPAQAAEIQRTIAEIERAKADFPNISIAYMQRQYNNAEVSATGGVIGYVARDLYNTALLSVQKQMANGAMAADHEVLIVRGDADVRGQSRRQLINFRRTMEENPDADVIKGTTRYGVAEQEKFPGFGIVTNFSSAVTMMEARVGGVHTGGANFAVRASTLAAVGGLGEMYIEGANGKLVLNTGVGSDDMVIGKRIKAARVVGESIGGGGHFANDSTQGSRASANTIRRVKLAAGAGIDTDPRRLIPYYLNGEWFEAAWFGGRGAFDDGPGGYRPREMDASAIDTAPKEEFRNAEATYATIEANISQSLSVVSDYSARKALAVFFGAVPGAYRIIGELGESNVQFKLTDAGREYIKNRVERETNGHYGSYGLRKNRQIYGVLKPGARRQPAAATAPFVSPAE